MVKVVIGVTIHSAEQRKQNFGQVSNAFIRVVNQSNNEEVARYDLSEDYSLLAIQGPKAVEAMQSLSSLDLADIPFYKFKFLHLL